LKRAYKLGLAEEPGFFRSFKSPIAATVALCGCRCFPRFAHSAQLFRMQLSEGPGTTARSGGRSLKVRVIQQIREGTFTRKDSD